MSIMSRAEAYWRADQYSGSGNWLDLSVNGHDAVPGAGAAAPVFFDCPQQYVWLPGNASNILSTPHANIGALTGNVTITVDVTLSDYTPAATQVLFNKLTGNSGIKLELTTATNVLTLTVGDGAATEALASTAVTGLTDLTRNTITAEWIDATSVIFRLNGTKLGNTVVGSKTLADDGGAASVGVLTGRVHRITVTKAAATVANLVASEWGNAASTHTDSAGCVWTVTPSGTADQARVVTRPHFLYHTAKYHTVADHADLDFAETDPYTVAIALRSFINTTAVAISKKAGAATDAGYNISQVALVFRTRVADGTNTAPADTGAISLKVPYVVAGVRSVASDNLIAYLDGTASAPTTDNSAATNANAKNLIIGANGDIGVFLNGEVYAAAVWRSALTATEVKSLQSEMLPGGGGMMMLGVG